MATEAMDCKMIPVWLPLLYFTWMLHLFYKEFLKAICILTCYELYPLLFQQFRSIRQMPKSCRTRHSLAQSSLRNHPRSIWRHHCRLKILIHFCKPWFSKILSLDICFTKTLFVFVNLHKTYFVRKKKWLESWDFEVCSFWARLDFWTQSWSGQLLK